MSRDVQDEYVREMVSKQTMPRYCDNHWKVKYLPMEQGLRPEDESTQSRQNYACAESHGSLPQRSGEPLQSLTRFCCLQDGTPVVLAKVIAALGSAGKL